MRVPAHTSKVGFHTLYANVNMEASYVSNGSWTPWQRSTDKRMILAYSYKTPSINSDGVYPTQYTRKIGRLLFSSWEQKTNSNKQRGENSAYYLQLNATPYGMTYSSGNVGVSDWMQNQVIQQCMQDLMDLRANILEDLAQARQTLSQLTNIFNTIVKLFLIIRRRQWRKLRRMLRGLKRDPHKKISNAWLGWYYGIRPLVSTFSAICQSYRPRDGIMVTNKRKASNALDPERFIVGTSVRVTGNAQERVQCEMAVRITAGADLRYWTSLGLTGNMADDALVTVWALMPYSFVVDWILPVEQFLRTRSFTSSVDYRYGYLSKSVTCDGNADGNAVGIGSGTKSRPGPSAKFKVLMFEREVYAFQPPSGLSIKQSLNPTNLLNAAALVAQRI